MKNLPFTLHLTTVIIAISLCCQVRATAPPNLFLFIADDLGYNDISIHGHPYVKTPTIDAFAENAINFTKMHTASAMCTPSRSMLYTGLYPHRNGCHMNHGNTYKHIKTLPVYLKELGYSVALVEKTHIKPKEVYPFDYILKDDLDHYLDTAKAPFCIIYASHEPHGPHRNNTHNADSVILPAKWTDTPGTRNLIAGYYTDVELLEKEFAAFTETIKRKKLDKNSISIFTSDHGYSHFAKWTCYQSGLHVPFYMQANGLSFNSKEINQLTSFVDIVPTFIELAGGTASDTLDGKSLLPLLKGESDKHHKYVYGAHTNRGIISGKAYPIRSVNDGKWKYIRNLNHEGQFQNITTNGLAFDSVPTNKLWIEWLEKKDESPWVTYLQNRPYEELYDLENDPNEMNNLAENKKYKKQLAALSTQLDTWMKEQNDTGMEAEMKVPLKAMKRKKRK